MIFRKSYLWVIEAVTSDGEVDIHKVESLIKLTKRSGKSGVGFTTTYIDWNTAAKRQGKYKNIHVGTYIWIMNDPSKHFFVKPIDHCFRSHPLLKKK